MSGSGTSTSGSAAADSVSGAASSGSGTSIRGSTSDSTDSGAVPPAALTALMDEMQTLRVQTEEWRLKQAAAAELADRRARELEELEQKLKHDTAAFTAEQASLREQVKRVQSEETGKLADVTRNYQLELEKREAAWSADRKAMASRIETALRDRELAAAQAREIAQEMNERLAKAHAVHAEAAAELLRATDGYRLAAAMRGKVRAA